MGIQKATATSISHRKTPFGRTAVKSRFAKSSEVKHAEVSGNFEVGQKVVYPGQGVGQVLAIEVMEVGGMKNSVYKIRILENDLVIRLPVNRVATSGVRPIVSTDEVKTVYRMLKDRKVVVEQTTWNRRYREYMEKIKTGSIFEITEVLRDLCVIKADKVLSFGERKMLELAKGLLVKELAIAEETDEPTVEAQIEELFAA